MSDELERGGFSSAAGDLLKHFDERDRKAGAGGRAKKQKDDKENGKPAQDGEGKLHFTDEEPEEGKSLPATKEGEGYKIKWKGGTIISQ
jgi:hypothetical protein